MHKHLRRLDRLWIEQPIYFITTCTKNRRSVLASARTAQVLVAEFREARERHGWAIGEYVVMPDHVHFFGRPEHDAKPLPEFMREWKSWTSRRIRELQPRPPTAATGLWQREYFDHVLRSGESYSEKWNYVRDNPVRAALVTSADDWPYVGTIEDLSFA